MLNQGNISKFTIGNVAFVDIDDKYLPSCEYYLICKVQEQACNAHIGRSAWTIVSNLRLSTPEKHEKKHQQHCSGCSEGIYE